ncbi:hypothetical protein HUO13_34685 [Saccharopolyspora erythraea]|uniref:sunset domain-containing protein n=1 Tax=Saccharopolyspora erythraea TaxID=1836 RepID=UPI001BACA9FA|nr:hypothetical protein [Saccharopolyspora erythraea]QUH05241.1 hypothetical protein HUO13_34685 [Saccharopolyspora erythraea]
MTWLFTQVWLWSLAAFALGSLFTWLLFVRPLRRRLDAVSADYADYVRETEDSGRDRERTLTAMEPDEGPLDLLEPAEPVRADRLGPAQPTALVDRDELPGQAQDEAEEPAFGAWDRAPRAWAAPVPPAGDSAEVTQQVERITDDDTARQPVEPAPRPPEPAWGSDGPSREFAARVRADAEREPEPVEPAWQPAGTSRDAAESARVPEGIELADDEAAGRSTWFQKSMRADKQENPEWPAEADEPTGSDSAQDSAESPGRAEPAARVPASAESGAREDTERDAQLSGQLRSLFEPLGDPGVDEARKDTPYVPPLGAEATQNIPRITDDAEPDSDAPPLPRRTPGVGPRPGKPKTTSNSGRNGSSNGSGPAAANGSSGSASNGSAESPSGDASGKNAPATDTKQHVGPTRREGYMVKGHFASRQYHTPESPQYERIVAEVWFRTAADAEQAGFEPWDGRQHNT